MRNAQHAYETIGCHEGKPISEQRGNCVVGTGDAWTAALVGDSNANHLLPAFRRVMGHLPGRLYATSLGHCPLLDVEVTLDGERRQPCVERNARLVEELVAARFDYVFIANALDDYIYSPRYSVRLPSGRTISSTSERAETLAQSLGRVVERLTAAGSQVVLVNPLPKFVHGADVPWHRQRAWDLGDGLAGRCSVLSLRINPQWCNISRPIIGGGWRDTRPVAQIHRSIAGPVVSVLDLAESMCPEECSAIDVSTGTVRYVNGGHITVSAAESLADTIGVFLHDLVDR